LIKKNNGAAKIVRPKPIAPCLVDPIVAIMSLIPFNHLGFNSPPLVGAQRRSRLRGGKSSFRRKPESRNQTGCPGLLIAGAGLSGPA